jgi:hypothetical protein
METTIKYWHLTSPLGAFMKPAVPALNVLDQFLTRVRLVKLMGWVFTFQLHKRPN